VERNEDVNKQVVHGDILNR